MFFKSRKKSRPRKSVLPQKSKLRFESLEDRRLLSVDSSPLVAESSVFESSIVEASPVEASVGVALDFGTFTVSGLSGIGDEGEMLFEVGQTLTITANEGSAAIKKVDWSFNDADDTKTQSGGSYVFTPTLDDYNAANGVSAKVTVGFKTTILDFKCAPQRVSIAPDYDELQLAINRVDSAAEICFTESGTVELEDTLLLTQAVTINGKVGDGEQNVVIKAPDGGGPIMVVDADDDAIILKNLDVNGASSSLFDVSSELFVVDSRFYNFHNTIEGESAVFYVQEWATLIIDHSTFEDNSAVYGTIYNKGWLSVTNSTFTSNSASSNGGAIYNAGKATVVGSTFTRNEAIIDGGAIYNTGNATVLDSTFGNDIDLTNDYDLDTLAQALVSEGNKAGRYGGAISNNDGVVTVSSSVINGNVAVKNGGAVFNNYGKSLNVIGAMKVIGNEAKNGGAFANYGTATFKVDDAIFEANTATAFGGAYFGIGALQLEGSASFLANKANKGGAIYNYRSGNYVGDINIVGSINFEDNFAEARGGAIINYSKLAISSDPNDAESEVVFSYNSSLTFGGAVDLETGSSTTFAGSTVFEYNYAYGNDGVDGYGGAIFSAGDLKFSVGGNYVFNGNMANNSGGAIDALKGTFELAGAFTFTGNLANGNYLLSKTGVGGAILSVTKTVIDANTSFKWGKNNHSYKSSYGDYVAIDLSVSGNEELTYEDFGIATSLKSKFLEVRAMKK